MERPGFRFVASLHLTALAVVLVFTLLRCESDARDRRLSHRGLRILARNVRHRPTHPFRPRDACRS